MKILLLVLLLVSCSSEHMREQERKMKLAKETFIKTCYPGKVHPAICKVVVNGYEFCFYRDWRHQNMVDCKVFNSLMKEKK